MSCSLALFVNLTLYGPFNVMFVMVLMPPVIPFQQAYKIFKFLIKTACDYSLVLHWSTINGYMQPKLYGIVHELWVFCQINSNGLYIENTKWVSFDIKFTRLGLENACWHPEASRAIQHAFSMPSLVNLISIDANLVFYLSVYKLLAIMTQL